MSIIRDLLVSIVSSFVLVILLVKFNVVNNNTIPTPQISPTPSSTTTEAVIINTENFNFNSCEVTSVGDCYPPISQPETSGCVRGYRFDPATGQQIWFQTETKECEEYFKSMTVPQVSTPTNNAPLPKPDGGCHKLMCIYKNPKQGLEEKIRNSICFEAVTNHHITGKSIFVDKKCLESINDKTYPVTIKIKGF